MFLEKISLTNFKNYTTYQTTFSPHINCLVGENGVGKTNLLDAIHFLSLTKSAFAYSDLQAIKRGQHFFLVQGSFIKSEKSYQVDCVVQQQKGKVFKINKKEYEKISQHIGEFPCILMLPYDTDLIREGSEVRRKFFDNVISQTNLTYLQQLMRYNHLLKQRNSLLTQFAEQNVFDKDLLTTYDVSLVKLNKELSQQRQQFTQQFMPLLQSYYEYLTEGKEIIDLQYETTCQSPDFEQTFIQNWSKDIAAQRTTIGIHKDDFLFTLNSFPMAKYGSQGQQKSYVVALRMAQAAIIQRLKGIKPLLLLDDIFDKLDEQRIQRLLAKIDDGEFGQVFLTDARPERTKTLIKDLKRETNLIIL